MYSLELFLSLVFHTDIFYYLECEGHPRVVDGGELELEIVGILLGLLYRLLGRLLVGDDGPDPISFVTESHSLARLLQLCTQEPSPHAPTRHPTRHRTVPPPRCVLELIFDRS